MKNLSKEQIETNKNEFLSLLDKAADLKPEMKEGITKLKEDLLKSDFFIAPAASKKEFHGCYDGGLCEHSINVYKELLRQLEAHKDFIGEEISEYSIIITALLHDLCKINYYKKQVVGHYEKNSDGTVVIENGKKKWVDEEGYVIVPPKRELGHGSKSLYNIMRYIPLNGQEAEAIFWHMGPFDAESPNANRIHMSNAFNHNKLAFFLQVADYSETYLQGRE